MKHFLLLLTLFTALSAEDIYPSLWKSLLERHNATFRYYDESVLPNESRREQLATGQTLSGGPQFSASGNGISDGEFLMGNRIDWTHPRWSSSLYLQNSNERLENGSFQLMYALLSDLNGRLEDLDTVSSLIRQKALLQRKAVLFNDFKQLLAYKIQYDLYTAEHQIRNEIDLKGKEFLGDLNRLIKAGIVPRNATQSIQLFLRDNSLRVKALQLESELLVDNVFYHYEIERELFLGIEMDSLLEKLSLDSAVNIASYSWKMDSLNSAIQTAQLQEQNRTNWRLSVGAGTNFHEYESPSTYNNSLMVQFSLDFRKKVLPSDAPLKKRQMSSVSNSILDDLKEYKIDAQNYSETASEWIGTTLKRIKLGELGIMYELSQNLDIIINNKLKYFTLRSNYYRRELAQFRALTQLPENMEPAL